MVRSVSALVLLLALPACAPAPDSEEGVIQEAWALERDPVLRPTHVDPALPGTFADGIAPWADALVASERRCGSFGKALLAALEHHQPLPAEWVAEVDGSAAMLDGALAATYRAGASLPPGLRMQAVFLTTHPSTIEFRYLGRLAIAGARLASDRGDHALALRRCADALALSRDMSWGALVFARAGSMAGHTLQVCYELALRAPVGPRRDFLKAVDRIRAGWAPSSSVIRQERLFTQLLSASSFSAAHLAAFPPALAPVLEMPEAVPMNPLRAWPFRGAARRAIHARMTRLMNAADLPPDDADRVFAEVEADSPLWLTLAGLGDAPPLWLRFGRELRRPRAQLALLHAALAADLYRADHGALPKTWADVFPTGAPADPRTGRTLALDLRADAPAVRAEGDPAREAEPLSFSLAPP